MRGAVERSETERFIPYTGAISEKECDVYE
jgi:hypothetical protein